MYEESQIATANGETALTYAKNKNTGGRSSAKGRDFELTYGAYRIAIEGAQEHDSGGLGADVSFHDQVLCFIDDFVTTRDGKRTLEQLKSGAVSWGGGDHPLADDFRMQMQLDRFCGADASYRLVVSTPERREALKSARPADLASVAVCSFPEGLTDLETIDLLPNLRVALGKLSARKPERVVHDQVFKLILGTWAGSSGTQTLGQIINAAATGPGAIVAPMLPQHELSQSAKNVLDNIPQLRFYIERNFFRYECGWMTGYAEYHCHSPEFAAFEAELASDRPVDFLGFFAILKAHV